jgi:secreted PhoX family phosphatase
VNHELTDPLLILGEPLSPANFTAEFAAKFLANMGGSCVRMARNAAGRWRPLVPDPRNFRLSGHTPNIQLTGPAAGTPWVHGAKTVTGSIANCGGGVSPWGTIFSSEENVYTVWGDPELGDPPSTITRFFARPAEHYGYMVEVDPDTGEFFKHTALGRFAHENIVFRIARDGRLVGYMGDDRPQQCIYKYNPAAGKANRHLLEKGTLFAASTTRGRWLPLDPARQSTLKAVGFDAARVCVHTRTAARWVGATAHGRPEGIEVHPVTGEVFVALTAHEIPSTESGGMTDLAGAIARIREAGNDPAAMEFDFDLFLMAGAKTGLAWPDNLRFTTRGNLVVCTDYHSSIPLRPRSTHAYFGNNFLLVVPTSGPNAGKVTRFAAGPVAAEFCSPTFTPEGDELWVNVQHPGEGSQGRDHLLSHWPEGGAAWPKSSLVAIRRG